MKTCASNGIHIDKENEPFKETGVNGAGSSLANAEDFMGLAGSSRSLFKLSISPVRDF